ncbi:hypothetical protein [Burkholderia glumae]|uniref:hypothetical protein n=1 Tax=Burkholderia glumae TaxID=337 RepID=UPI002150ECBE|nr:hypothetical protein [Burkholderia glumae]UVS93465.1 hypothetical protein EFP17_28190 [Burkholderia glumae]
MNEQSTETAARKCVYVLHFDSEEQRAQLKASAALNRRTLNAEILSLIERGKEAGNAEQNAG